MKENKVGALVYEWAWYSTSGRGIVQVGVVLYKWVWYCINGYGIVQVYLSQELLGVPHVHEASPLFHQERT